MEDIKTLVDGLSLEQKARLLTGKNFWQTRGIEHLGIDSILMADGPHGLRKQTGSADHLGLNGSSPAVCYPTASALACSFNEALIEEMGRGLGHAARSEGINVLLGPGNNIKRSPLCGRNFEYFSEDPLLSGKMASAMIKGIQSQRVGASLKHFAVNNQEHYRMVVNAVVDERTLREIYLASFEIPVKEARPWTVMSAYNRINGVYASENARLLNGVLREEWGFDGLVVTDWGANDQLWKAVAGGLDLEMPSSGDVGPHNVISAVKDGRLAMADIDTAVTHLFRLIERCRTAADEPLYLLAEAHAQARRVAEECIVLLKNEEAILPLDPERHANVAVIGEFAMSPRYQGSGSSRVNPYQVTSLIDSLNAADTKFNISYAPGYRCDSDEVDTLLISEAACLAAQSDIVLLCAGLTDDYESEGRDRTHLNMPANQLALIDAVLDRNPNTIIVLSNGSVIKMPFADRAPVILEAWLTGEAGAEAVVNILLGKVNPSGRLAESFIRDEQQDPSQGNFPGRDYEVVYQEGVFIGYRAHQRLGNEVTFPFGHGLSYTTFDYRDLVVRQLGYSQFEAEVTVTNTGRIAGKEVVQLYVGEQQPLVSRPVRELKGFAKLELAPGESRQVVFALDKRCFAYYNTDLADWHVNADDFLIEIGRSCEEIELTAEVYASDNCQVSQIPQPRFVQREAFFKTVDISRNSTVSDLKDHPTGKFLYRKIVSGATGGGEEVVSKDIQLRMANELPLRNLVSFNAGKDLDEKGLDVILKVLNATRRDTLLGKCIDLFTRHR
ncbi:glycoside hydrolase family 3 C-terminal domain-containing protein [Photobacterium sp. OFAV2-7]|uniref:glycoside hydrolase family 3 C-terminal domain-containing protein n=1 Tax=Photobacterium sp. OFAV2-7 TaxID=2917748 RepID=UPI001EF5FBA2|nr:glycoside hydrolase family 3 C-terminal domain-containing protein [Photobacterium sp. OFAV2-7]MCG7584333.1 glycoside hydrolase family 3 C-terminal domain-containing protein [Photobacterium sp. OFAV2-7]